MSTYKVVRYYQPFEYDQGRLSRNWNASAEYVQQREAREVRVQGNDVTQRVGSTMRVRSEMIPVNKQIPSWEIRL